MSVSMLDANAMTTKDDESHLDAHVIAAYLDGAASTETRGSVESHIAGCSECRDEVLQLLRARPKPVPARIPVWRAAATVAAAAVVVLAVWPRASTDVSTHRERPIAATIAPRLIAPSGVTNEPAALVWSAVPNADGYVVRVFDARGDVVWQRETADTTAAAPDSAVRAGERYFWRVEARTGFGRSVASDLVEFRPRQP